MSALKQYTNKLFAKIIECLESFIGDDIVYGHRAGTPTHSLGIALQRSGQITMSKQGAFYVVQGVNGVVTKDVYLHNAVAEYINKLEKANK